MAKKQSKKTFSDFNKNKVISKSRQNIIAIDNYPVIKKYFWVIIPLLTLIYYFSSKYSVGFYQDDEVGQYINMIQFWKDPFIILGNYPKPGYKIFMVVPSLFGYDAVLLFNSFIASLAVYFTYVLLKVYKIGYAYFGAILLAVEPLFFDLSFRSYAEIFTSLLILVLLILYKKEYYLWAALLCGYIFTVRQEIILLMIVFAFLFYKKKKFLAILAIAFFPVLYDLLGYMKTGDILFVISQMSSVASLTYKSQGMFHYFIVYIFIIGPVALMLFLCGFFGFLSDSKKYFEYLKQYSMLYIVFVSVFSVQVFTMFTDGPNPGNWRYLLHISPIASVFATIGLNNLIKPDFRKTSYIIIGILAFITMAFLSRTTDGFILLDTNDYGKFLVMIISLSLILMMKKEPYINYLNKLSSALLVIAIGYLLVSFTPKKLSPENIAIKQTSEFVNTINIKDKHILFNHTFIPFYNDKYFRESPNNFKRLITENLKEAKKGSILLWDSHYGYRPEFGNDVKLEVLQNDPQYKLLNKINSGDGRFISFIFEKLN